MNRDQFEAGRRLEEHRLRFRDAIIRTGWSKTAKLTGLERTALHRSFGTKPKDVKLSTLLRLAPVVGLKIDIA